MAIHFIIKTHRWLSLVLGLPVAVAAISGLPLVFWETTDALTSPTFYPAGDSAAPLLSLETSMTEVRQYHPGATIHSVYLPRHSSAVHIGVGFSDGRNAELGFDRATGAPIGTREFATTPIGRLYRFHVSFFAGDMGRWMMFGLAWALLVSTVLGVWIWLRRYLSARGRQRLPRRRTLALALHNSVGIWAALLLVSMSGTTLWLTWPTSPASTGPEAARATGATTDLDAYAAAALASRPGSVLRSLSRLDDPGPVRVMVENRWGVLRQLSLDKHSAGVLSDQFLPATSSASLMRGVHSGNALGHIGRWLMAAASVLPLVLWVTGFLMWRRRIAPGG